MVLHAPCLPDLRCVASEVFSVRMNTIGKRCELVQDSKAASTAQLRARPGGLSSEQGAGSTVSFAIIKVFKFKRSLDSSVIPCTSNNKIELIFSQEIL